MGSNEVEQLRVESLYRYPVKSMLGERVDALLIDARGAEGDRRLALLDGSTGRVASAERRGCGVISCGAPRAWTR